MVDLLKRRHGTPGKDNSGQLDIHIGKKQSMTSHNTKNLFQVKDTTCESKNNTI